MKKAKLPEFTRGHVTYSITYVGREAVATLLDETWKDGFLAFSNGEGRFSEFWAMKGADFVTDKVPGLPNHLEGCLTEAGLWRNSGGLFTELAIERQDSAESPFFVQTITLDTNHARADTNCLWRPFATVPYPAKNTLFAKPDLDCLEIVHPGRRMHFYLTAGSGVTI